MGLEGGDDLLDGFGGVDGGEAQCGVEFIDLAECVDPDDVFGDALSPEEGGVAIVAVFGVEFHFGVWGVCSDSAFE